MLMGRLLLRYRNIDDIVKHVASVVRRAVQLCDIRFECKGVPISIPKSFPTKLFKVFLVSNLEKLRDAKTLNDLAHLLGYKPRVLGYLVYKMESNKYHHFSIPKKSGGVRDIYAPNEKLKLLQRRLADLLSVCEKEISNKIPSQRKSRSAVSHGFRKGFSIISNSELHTGKRYVLNIDLENFFPSFNFGRVRGFFLKDKNFNLAPPVATSIAQIACYQDTLPQGSPCSPVIANLISRYLDMRLLYLCKSCGCTYTRYADDISISSNRKVFPKEILKKNHWFNSKKPRLGKELIGAIVDSGFKINKNKTRLQHRTSRQEVTGLTVNKLVNVNKKYYRDLRAMCHSLFQKGTYHLPNSQRRFHTTANSSTYLLDIFLSLFSKNKDPFLPSKETENQQTILSKLDCIEGRLNFVYEVKKHRNKYARSGYRQHSHHIRDITAKGKTTASEQFKSHRANSYFDENHIKTIDGIKNLYSKFLLFKYFYKSAMPILVCEGKTDIVYIKCAFSRLRKDFPELIDKKTSLKKFTFLKPSKKNMDLLFHDGGTSNLCYLLTNYKHNLKYFKAVGEEQPVIVILDNDKAGKGVLRKFNIEYKEGTNIYNMFNNVYSIVIPSVEQGKDCPIEYLFDLSVRETELDGKKPCFSNKPFDHSKYYSKHIFAEKVIKANQQNINFDRFGSIFWSIEKIINMHSKVV